MYHDVLSLLVGPNELATCCSKCADLEDFQVSPFTATCFVGARKTAMLGKNFFQLTLNRQEICGKACGRHGSWWSYNPGCTRFAPYCLHKRLSAKAPYLSAGRQCWVDCGGYQRSLLPDDAPGTPIRSKAWEMSFVDISGALVRIGVEGAV